MNNNQTLSTKQRRAIDALLCTANTSQAAKVVGVQRSTIYRWMRQEPFQQALAQAEAQALANLSRSLVALSEKATEAFDDGLKAKDLRVRIRTADIITQRLLSIRELVDIEARITELENRLP